MPRTNEKVGRYKTIDKTCIAANSFYLLLHIFYLVLFLVSKLYVMVYVTAAIVGIYALFFLLIKFKKYYIYALCCGNEFFAFIIFASIMVGFSTGFHFFLIGFCVVSFFTTYFSKNKSAKGSLIWVTLSAIIYLSLFFVSEFVDPVYQIEKWLEITLFTTHAVINFVIIASFLSIILKYALSLEHKITIESRTDELTQVANRYGLYDYFDQDTNKQSKVLALFDIDDFKKINDTYGHIAGDYVLKRIAEIAGEAIENSFVARYGGEEFVVLLDDNKINSYFDRLEVFRKMVAKEIFEFEDMTINLTITIGAVKYIDGISLQKWVDKADDKMYEGKNSGKNKTVI